MLQISGMDCLMVTLGVTGLLTRYQTLQLQPLTIRGSNPKISFPLYSGRLLLNYRSVAFGVFDVRSRFLGFVLPGCGLAHYTEASLTATALWMNQRGRIRMCRGGASEAEWR